MCDVHQTTQNAVLIVLWERKLRVFKNIRGPHTLIPAGSGLNTIAVDVFTLGEPRRSRKLRLSINCQRLSS